VLSVNDRPIESYLQLLRRVAILAPGSEARLTISRDNKEREVKVKLGERPAAEVLKVLGTGESTVPLGIVVQDVTPEVTAATGVVGGAGAYVAGVVPGSAAEAAGLRAGDIITEVNRTPVRDRGGYQEALDAAGTEADVLVRYQRGETSRYVALR
ncbi:MAG TPA: PDZ domain-containing protein, partial [Myxococcaceae bacterium]|nr:PDZ domain-containing protein [Myxococcaceae bacterium]